MVSWRDSPFWTLVPPGSEKPIMRAPSWLAALSNESLVRVEGSKKSVANLNVFFFGEVGDGDEIASF